MYLLKQPICTLRMGRASRRSEKMNWQPAREFAKACSGRITGNNAGGLSCRDCWADSRRIFSHRSDRFSAALINRFSLRAPAIGTISATPSSVDFSKHHSKRSNLTTDNNNSIRRDGVDASTDSMSENSPSLPFRDELRTFSTRPSQICRPSLNSYSWPSSARSTRPRCSAASPRSTAVSPSNSSTKNRLRMCWKIERLPEISKRSRATRRTPTSYTLFQTFCAAGFARPNTQHHRELFCRALTEDVFNFVEEARAAFGGVVLHLHDLTHPLKDSLLLSRKLRRDVNAHVDI